MNKKIISSLLCTIGSVAALLVSHEAQAGAWKETLDYGHWDLVEDRAGRKLTACYDATLWGKKRDHARFKLWTLRLDAMVELKKTHPNPEPHELCTLLTALDEREDIKSAIEEKRRIKIKTWGRVLESKTWEEASETLESKHARCFKKETQILSVLSISRTVLWRSRLKALENLKKKHPNPDSETLIPLLRSIDEEEKVKSDLAFYLKNKQAALENASLRSLYMEIPDGSDADLPKGILDDLVFDDDPQEVKSEDRKGKGRDVEGEEGSSRGMPLQRSYGLSDVRGFLDHSSFPTQNGNERRGYSAMFSSVPNKFQPSALSEDEAMRWAMEESLRTYSTQRSGTDGASSSSSYPARGEASSSSSYPAGSGGSSSLAPGPDDDFDDAAIQKAIRLSLMQDEA